MTTAVRSPVTTYAEAVVSGVVVAGRLVRLACERHLRDLEHGHERGLHFDEEAAQYAIDFFELGLTLAEGEHADQPFILQPWQQFVTGCLFGWKAGDGTRRFRVAYIEIGKGNGKTPMAAGFGLFGLVADGENAAEIYTAGVTRDQANYLLADAQKCVAASPALKSRIEVNVHNLLYRKTNSYMRPVSSEARSLDQKRVHMALIDEIHEHRESVVVDKMRAGTKGRRQAMIVEITNSGYDRQTVCYQHHEMSARILEGALDNDAWFAYVCGLDPCDACRADGHTQPQDDCENCDDWRDEAVWLKANPNLGVSISWKYLREQVAEAIGMPAKQNIVKRLNFCIWTQSVTKWLNADDWEACSAEPVRIGPCFVGYDLSTTTDLAGFVRLWGPDEEGFYDVELKCYVPEENILERARRDGVPYDLWRDQGFIAATPGNVIDYAFIRGDMKKTDASYGVREVAGDPWNATQFQTWLQEEDGFTVVPIRQGFASMTAPSKELEKLVKSRKLRHGGNPVMRWAAANVVIELDAQGNIKPSKEKSTERIDPIVMLICALARAMVVPPEAEGGVMIIRRS